VQAKGTYEVVESNVAHPHRFTHSWDEGRMEAVLLSEELVGDFDGYYRSFLNQLDRAGIATMDDHPLDVNCMAGAFEQSRAVTFWDNEDDKRHFNAVYIGQVEANARDVFVLSFSYEFNTPCGDFDNVKTFDTDSERAKAMLVRSEVAASLEMVDPEYSETHELHSWVDADNGFGCSFRTPDMNAQVHPSRITCSLSRAAFWESVSIM
jgi:hypothetical protein